MEVSQTPYLSVVIATLGGATLSETIKSLNGSTIIPDEIIISIPEKEAGSIKIEEFDNVWINATKCRGQVPQRCEGFKVAKGQFVLQIDDDIILDPYCIERLIESLKKLGRKAACSAALRFIETDSSVYDMSVKRGMISKMYYLLLNGMKGYQEGIITKAGTEIGVNSKKDTSEMIPTEWIPGGVAMHYNENLILDNFYPFSGKAYSEDLFHSITLAKNGISLFIISNAVAWIDDPRNLSLPSLNVWYQNTLKDMTARDYLVKLLQKSKLRMLFFYCFSFCSYTIKRIRSK